MIELKKYISLGEIQFILQEISDKYKWEQGNKLLRNQELLIQDSDGYLLRFSEDLGGGFFAFNAPLFLNHVHSMWFSFNLKINLYKSYDCRDLSILVVAGGRFELTTFGRRLTTFTIFIIFSYFLYFLIF